MTEQSEDDDGAQIHERRNLFVSCSAPARRGRVRDVSIRARRGTGQTRSPNGEEVTRVVGAYHAPVSAHKCTRTKAIISYEEHFREMIRFDSSAHYFREIKRKASIYRESGIAQKKLQQHGRTRPLEYVQLVKIQGRGSRTKRRKNKWKLRHGHLEGQLQKANRSGWAGAARHDDLPPRRRIKQQSPRPGPIIA